MKFIKMVLPKHRGNIIEFYFQTNKRIHFVAAYWGSTGFVEIIKWFRDSTLHSIEEHWKANECLTELQIQKYLCLISNSAVARITKCVLQDNCEKYTRYVLSDIMKAKEQK